MIEGAPGGGTAVAERSTTPAPEQGANNKEKEIKQVMTPAVARVLAGSAVGPERFGPGKVDPLVDDEKAKISSLSPDGLAYRAASAVSMESRGKTTESYDDWKRGTEAWIQAQLNKELDIENTTRIEALLAVGAIQNESGHIEDTNVTVGDFYDKYLKGGSNIEGFIKDLSSLCTDETSGVVDMLEFHAYLRSVQPLLKVFGDYHRADLMVRDFAISRALLTQPSENRQHVVDQAVAQVPNAVPDTEGESRYLKALERKAKDLAAQPAPAQPTPDSPTPTPTPTSSERNGVQSDPQREWKVESTETVPGMTIRMGGATEIGSHQNNEDQMWFDAQKGVGIVCDGMGGLAAGDKASQFMMGRLRRSIDNPGTHTSAEAARDWLIREVEAANQAFGEEKLRDPSLADGGTTLSIAYIWRDPQGNASLITLRIGDSRLAWEEDGQMKDLMVDESTSLHHPLKSNWREIRDQVYAQANAGQLQGRALSDALSQAFEEHQRPQGEIEALQKLFNETEDPSKLTEEQQFLWDMRNKILSAVQGEDLGDLKDKTRIIQLPQEKTVRVLGLTDGITDVLSSDSIRLSLKPDPQATADSLIEAAKKGDGTARTKGAPPGDDKSVFVMDITITPPGTSESPDNSSPVGSGASEETGTTPSEVRRGETVKLSDGRTFMVGRVEGEMVHGSLLSDNPGEARDLRFYNDQMDRILPPDDGGEEQLQQGSASTPATDRTEAQVVIHGMAQGAAELARAVGEKMQKQKELYRQAKALLRPYMTEDGVLPTDLMNLINHHTNIPLEDLLPLPGKTLQIGGKTYTITGLTIDPKSSRNHSFTLNGPTTEHQMSLAEFRSRKTSEIAPQPARPEGQRVEIPRNVSVGGYQGQEYRKQVSLSTIFEHNLQPDRTYAALDHHPTHTDMYVTTTDNIYLLSVINPDETDNTKRRYRIFDARANRTGTQQRRSMQDLVGHELDHSQISGVTVNIGQQLQFPEKPTTGERVALSGEVTGVTVVHNQKPVRPGSTFAAVPTQDYFFDIVEGRRERVDVPKLGEDARRFDHYVRDHINELEAKIDGPQGVFAQMREKMQRGELTLDPRLESIIDQVDDAALQELNINRDELKNILATFHGGQERSTLQRISIITDLDITPGERMAKARDKSGEWEFPLSLDRERGGGWVPPGGRFENTGNLVLVLPRLKELHPDARTRRYTALWIFAHEFTHSLIDTNDFVAGAQGNPIQLPNGQPTTTAELFRERVLPQFPQSRPLTFYVSRLRNSDGTMPNGQDKPDAFRTAAKEEICETVTASLFGFAPGPDAAQTTTIQDPFTDRKDFQQAILDYVRAKKA